MTFCPYDFAGRLIAVYDIVTARAEGKLWQNLAKTIPAVSHGDPVRVYVDPYTLHEFAAASDATRPLLQLVSGRWCLAHGFTLTCTTPSLTAQFGVPCSGAWDWAATGYAGSGFTIPVATGPALSAGIGNGSVYIYTSAGCDGGSMTDALRHKYTVKFHATAGQAYVRLDGAQVATGATPAGGGGTLVIGQNVGHMSRAIFITGAFTAGELTDVEAWLDGTSPDEIPETDWYMPTFFPGDFGSDRMRVLVSRDADTWTQKQNIVFDATSNVTSDFAAVRFPADTDYGTGGYWVGYTAVPGTHVDNVNYAFGMSRSDDGQVYRQLPDVDVTGVTGIQKCWAPEPFVDHDGRVYWMFSGSLVAAPYDARTFSIYGIEQLTFTDTPTFGTPFMMLPCNGVDVASIDGFMVYRNGVHYLWYVSLVQWIEIVKSTTGITGPYTPHRTIDWAGWGYGIEGHAVVELPNGTWRMWTDRSPSGTIGMYYSDQTAGDWMGTGSTTWSALTVLDGPLVRHGTPSLLYAPPEPSTGGNGRDELRRRQRTLQEAGRYSRRLRAF